MHTSLRLPWIVVAGLLAFAANSRSDEREYKYYACGIGLLPDGSLKLVKYGKAEVGKADKQTASKIVHREDVVYGRAHGAGLLADIAYPESKEPLPAIISVHGGRWVGGHKRDASTIKVGQWAGFGFFAMSIDYRLKNCSPAPACYQDMGINEEVIEKSLAFIKEVSAKPIEDE